MNASSMGHFFWCAPKNAISQNGIHISPLTGFVADEVLKLGRTSEVIAVALETYQAVICLKAKLKLLW